MSYYRPAAASITTARFFSMLITCRHVQTESVFIKIHFSRGELVPQFPQSQTSWAVSAAGLGHNSALPGGHNARPSSAMHALSAWQTSRRFRLETDWETDQFSTRRNRPVQSENSARQSSAVQQRRAENVIRATRETREYLCGMWERNR